MKKKTLLYLISVTILLIIVGGVFVFKWNKNKEIQFQSENGILIVHNGTAITENVVIHLGKNHNSYADLPLTEVMKNFGMTVEWIDNDTAEVAYNGKKYTLKLSDISLIEFGDDYNLLLPPIGGGKRTRKILDRELVLDSTTIIYTLMEMGIRIKVDINHDELIVYISERND